MTQETNTRLLENSKCGSNGKYQKESMETEPNTGPLTPTEEKSGRKNPNQISDSKLQNSFRSLHEMFEMQAGRTPESWALVFEGQRLTYRELDQRAGRIAGRLQQLGVRPDTLVGICVERSRMLRQHPWLGPIFCLLKYGWWNAQYCLSYILPPEGKGFELRLFAINRTAFYRELLRVANRSTEYEQRDEIAPTQQASNTGVGIA